MGDRGEREPQQPSPSSFPLILAPFSILPAAGPSRKGSKYKVITTQEISDTAERRGNSIERSQSRREETSSRVYPGSAILDYSLALRKPRGCSNMLKKSREIPQILFSTRKIHSPRKKKKTFFQQQFALNRTRNESGNYE